MAVRVSFFKCLRISSSLEEFEENAAKWCDLENINNKNSSGQTLLHKVITDCARSSKADYLKFLLEKGVDPTARDHNGATPLYEIIDQIYLSEAEIENLAQLVDVTYTATVFNFSAQKNTRYGLDREHTALSLACCKILTPIVSKLLSRGASVETTVMLGLLHRCYHESGGSKTIKASLLHCLAERTVPREVDRVIPLAQLLLDRGLPIDIAPDLERITPLMLACARGNEVFVKWFLSLGAEINAVTTSGETPLNFAFTHFHFRPDLAVIRTLIVNGAVLGPKSTKFDFASNVYSCSDASFFHEELLKVLSSSSDEDPGLVSFWLLLACASGNLESVKAIFSSERLIDINISEGRGMTPFLLACEGENKEIVELLLTKGCNAKWRAEDGQCALHFAAKARDHELIRMLIPYMPEYLDLCSNSKKTPLVTTIEEGCFSAACVMALIEAGADHLITYLGETPLQIAERKNPSSEIVTYLRTLPQPCI